MLNTPLGDKWGLLTYDSQNYLTDRNCTGLTSIVVPSSVTSLSKNAFDGCSATITYMSLEDEFEIDAKTGFITGYAGVFDTLVIPSEINGVEVVGIEENVFRNDKTLQSVTFPDCLVSIKKGAFVGCTSLTEVTIPKSVKHIDENAFDLNLVIKGYRGSYAEIYAQDNFFTFVSLDKNLKQVSEVEASPKEGQISRGDKVTLKCNTKGAKIYYSLDSAMDLNENGIEYSEPIEIISDTTTIYAKAVKDNMADSNIAKFTYSIADKYTNLETNEIDKKDITENSVFVSAEMKTTENITEKGFIYYPANNSNLKQIKRVTSSEFSAKIMNLSEDTNYKVYAYVKVGNKTISSEAVEFKTGVESSEKPFSVDAGKSYASIGLGNSTTLAPIVLPEKSSNVIWYSEDESIATVDENGRITAVGEGETKIWCKTELGNLASPCIVKVSNKNIETGLDFSELNMAAYASQSLNRGKGFTVEVSGDKTGLDGGGNPMMGLAYLAGWKGAVLENNDQYPTNESEIKYNEMNEDYHIQEAIIIADRNDETDNEEIKKAIIKHGAIVSRFCSENQYWNNNYKDYYMPKDVKSNFGHYIAIVGWDDNYSKDNFLIKPPTDGAFICKNSWGTYVGDNGYFYISYCDAYIGKSNCVFSQIETKTNYNKIYQYDPYGNTGKISAKNKKAYMANVFTAQNKEYLTAVSFYTLEKNDDYEIYVVNNYEGTKSLTNLKNPVKTGTFEESGYHTVKIDPVTLNEGAKFAIVVKLKNSSSYVSFAVEYPHTYYENARANFGESFISTNGNKWSDACSRMENMNLCIKAFTIDPNNLETLQEGVDNDNREYESDKVYSLEELSDDVELNPEFVEYYNNQQNNDGLNILSIDNGNNYSMGAIPDPVRIDDNGYQLAQGMIIPKKYDLREEKLVTNVKNQGDYGTCWAFAVYASLESCILKNSSYVSGDFSELNDIIAELNKNSNIEVESLDMPEKDMVLSAGESKNIKVDIKPINATSQNLLWASSNPSVVSVNSSGYVTAKNCGRATITVMIVTEKGVKTASCNIMVTQDGKVFGDADNNLVVDENDVKEIMNKALNNDYKMAIEENDNNWILLLDYDGDGKITASDVVGLKHYIINNK